MAVYKSSSKRFVLDAGETNFTIPAELPGTQTPTPAQSGILGNALANTLTGDATHNGLDGGAGADSLIGGLGDDYYTVDDVGDVIVEYANQGIDVVLSTMSFTLGAHVDNLFLEGTDDLAATGNDLANDLIGNGGANTLDGGAGNDTLSGGGGADIFRGGFGSDTVVLSGSSGSTVNLAKGIAYGGRADGITLVDIENIWASFYNDVLTGDAASNVLKGQNGNDRLSGGSGRDRLFGGEGKDILTGGRGKDAFVFDRATTKATRDKIVDFKVKDDSIWLDNEVFTKLGRRGTEDKPVKLSNKFFKFNKPTDKNDYLIYKQKTGVLSYDADGSGKGKAVDIAILKKNLKLTDKDFFII